MDEEDWNECVSVSCTPNQYTGTVYNFSYLIYDYLQNCIDILGMKAFAVYLNIDIAILTPYGKILVVYADPDLIIHNASGIYTVYNTLDMSDFVDWFFTTNHKSVPIVILQTGERTANFHYDIAVPKIPFAVSKVPFKDIA